MKHRNDVPLSASALVLGLVSVLSFLSCEPRAKSGPDSETRVEVESGEDPEPAVELEKRTATAETPASKTPTAETREANATAAAESRPPPERRIVTVVEFSDFQCPFSRRVARLRGKMQEKYPGQVVWIFKCFPLDFHHQAPLAHEASLAARERDLFWEMHQLIFDDQEHLDRDSLVARALELGIPRDEFTLLLDGHAFTSEVQRDIADGHARGVTGTPTFYIDGQKLSGAKSPEVFEYYIRRALRLPVAIPPALLSPEALALDPEEGHPLAFGPQDAPVVLKVFADIRSPLGEKAVPLIRSLLDRHRGRLRFVFKSCPLGFYAGSDLASRAAMAARGQGADFLELWQRAAAHRGEVDLELIRDWLASIGLGGEQLEKGMQEVASEVHAPWLTGDLRAAERHEIRGSPTLLLQGERYDGINGLKTAMNELESDFDGLAARRPGKDLDLLEAGPPSRCADDDTALAPPPPDTPSVSPPSALVHDFGEVARGSAVRHRFVIRNEGATALRLGKVAAPASVQVGDYSREIAAESTGFVEVTLFTGRHRGAVSVEFFLSTSDPRQPRIHGVLTGSASEEVTVTPDDGVQIYGILGDRIAGSIDIAIDGDTPRDVELEASEVPELKIDIVPLQPGFYYRARVLLPEDAPAGERSGLIHFRTSHPRFPRVSVHFSALVQPEFIFTPAVLELRSGEGRPRKPAWIHVRNSRLERFALIGFRSELEGLRVEPPRTSAEVDHRWLVYPPADVLSSAGDGEIELTIKRAARGETLTLRLPFRFTR